MAIPSSGAISLTTVQTEFGGSNPISLSEYYAGGSFVPSGTTGTYGAVPSSGAISLRNFYGTSAVLIVVNDALIDKTDFGSASAYYFLTAGGQVEGSTNTGGVGPYNIGQWCTPTSEVSNYEARVTVVSGALTGGSGTGTFVALSTTKNWYVENVNSGTIEECVFTVEIRRVGTGTILDSATITLRTEVI